MEAKFEEKENQPLKENRKKPYAAPQLLMYGDVREITRTVGNSGNVDGGAPPTQKSQP